MGEPKISTKEERVHTAKRKGPNIYLITAIVSLVLIAAVVVLTALYINTRGALSEAELKLKLHEDVEAALEAKNSENETLIQALQGQIEDFLNIEEPAPVITSDQISEALTAASELVTQRYVYTNAARREANKTWLWDWTMPFSDTSLLVTYDGEIKAGIDFSEITVDVEESTRTITVALPPSKVLNNDIPQENIQVLEVKNNLFNEVTFNDYNEFIAAEKPVMQEKAISMGLLADADREARTIIRAFLNAVPGIDTYTLDIVTK